MRRWRSVQRRLVASSSHASSIFKRRYGPSLNWRASKAALSVLPDSENVAVRAVAALAKYESSGGEAALEELRDLAVEIEGEDVEGDDRDKWLVRTLAGTAFAKAGEVEEALETLGAGSNTISLEACVSCLPPASPAVSR